MRISIGLSKDELEKKEVKRIVKKLVNKYVGKVKDYSEIYGKINFIIYLDKQAYQEKIEKSRKGGMPLSSEKMNEIAKELAQISFQYASSSRKIETKLNKFEEQEVKKMLKNLGYNFYKGRNDKKVLKEYKERKRMKGKK